MDIYSDLLQGSKTIAKRGKKIRDKNRSVYNSSSEIKTFHPTEKLLKQKSKQLKELQEVPKPDQIHYPLSPLLPLQPE